ncbi:MAG TPA: hypothetical protein VH641_00145 [Streptosporangiaceae bacterium]|jgi:hypothetical protein
MLRRFLNWLMRPAARPQRQRSRLSGCLLWALILLAVLVVLSLMFGSFQKGTKEGIPARAPVHVSATQ